MEKWNFRDCRISKLRKQFSLKKVETLNSLENLLNSDFTAEDGDIWVLNKYQKTLKANAFNWNEQELALHFIGPMLSLSGFGNEDFFNSFAERTLSAVIQGIELSGRVDGMIAAGREEPEIPYFCLQEYKKETNPDGDPMAQALSAMLAAQSLNEVAEVVFGAYVNGRSWYFMALEGKEFSISQQYDACKNDIFDIFRILNGLRVMLENKLNNQNI